MENDALDGRLVGGHMSCLKSAKSSVAEKTAVSVLLRQFHERRIEEQSPFLYKSRRRTRP